MDYRFLIILKIKYLNVKDAISKFQKNVFHKTIVGCETLLRIILVVFYFQI